MARIVCIAFFLLLGTSTNASEKIMPLRLVYVFSEHCVFCKAWERDVENLYRDTEYAKKAPLFKIDISDFSTYFTDVTPMVEVTPTFILMSGNNEVSRIVGYQNRDIFFWALSEHMGH